jgi:hypothetical protein
MSSVSSPRRPTSQIRRVASCRDSPSRSIASRRKSAMPTPAVPGPEDHHALVAHPRAGRADARDSRGERDGSGALHVVVERQDLRGVALEDAAGVLDPEVLPVQQRVREHPPCGRDVGVEEGVVLLAADAGVPVAEVERVGEQGRVVRADVQHDGTTRRGWMPAATV